MDFCFLSNLDVSSGPLSKGYLGKIAIQMARFPVSWERLHVIGGRQNNFRLLENGPSIHFPRECHQNAPGAEVSNDNSLVALLPSQNPPSPTRLTPDQAPPKSQIRADFRSFLVIFNRFRPILVKTGEMDSKSAPLRGAAQCIWPCGGRGLGLEVRS